MYRVRDLPGNEQYNIFAHENLEVIKETDLLRNWVRENRIYLPKAIIDLMNYTIDLSAEIRFEKEALINPKAAGHVKLNIDRDAQVVKCMKMDERLKGLLNTLTDECQKRLGLAE